MKPQHYIPLIALGVILAVVVASKLEKAPNAGGFLTRTVTTTNLNINTSTTSVVSAGAGLQYLEIQNRTGTTRIFCAWGTNAVAGSGIMINPNGSSTLTSLRITDANLLSKPMNCLSETASSTVTITKY